MTDRRWTEQALPVDQETFRRAKLGVGNIKVNRMHFEDGITQVRLKEFVKGRFTGSWLIARVKKVWSIPPDGDLELTLEFPPLAMNVVKGADEEQ